MRHRPFRSAAQHFLVRRYGTLSRWNCTASEIAQETGVPITTVRRICRDAKYPIQSAHEGGDFVNVIPVDSYMRMGHREIRSRY